MAPQGRAEGNAAKPTTTVASDTEMVALKKTADGWLASNDDVALHKDSAEMYRYIDGLLARHDEATVGRYLERMLRADPWALDYQLTYGELLARKGEAAALATRATRAIRFAENDATLQRAYRLANRAIPAPPPLSALTPQAKELVLLQTGDASVFCLEDLRAALASRLPIPVTIARIPLDYGPADRSALQQFVAAMRRKIEEIERKDPTFDTFLAAHDSSPARLAANDDDVLRILRIVTNESGGKPALEALNQHIEDARKSGGQWEQGKAIERTVAVLRPSLTAGRWFLAVTDLDLYAPGSNYLYGVALTGGPVGLISNYRFSAAFTKESPDRRRLQARLVKQALSSYGFMLGVPRCANPECARAYPNDLAEHDAKSDQLCPECRAGFERALGMKLPAPAEAF